MVRRILLVLAVLLSGLAALTAALVALGRIDLAGPAAAWASMALGRPVTIEALRLRPGLWPRVELEGLAIGNIEGGSRTEMARLRRASAEFELRSLLFGPPVLREVMVEGGFLLLERAAGQQANWHFGETGPARAEPLDRSRFPLLLSAKLQDGEIEVRTTGGRALRTRLEEATIRTESEAAPVLLRARGSYDAVPLSLEGRLEPVVRLRETARPYGTRLRIASGETVLDFDGHMLDPLDVDGAEGHAVLRAPSPDRLLALAGAEAELDGAILIEGRLEHRGDLWRLTEGRGHLAGEAMAIRLAELTEGARGKPDAVALDLGVDRLDLNRRLAAGSRADAARADLPLLVSEAPDPRLTAKLTAAELVYAGLEAREVEFDGALEPGRIAVRTLGLTTGGARLRASGEVARRPKGAAIAGQARMEEGDVETLRRAFGLRPLPIAGHLDGWIAVSAEGETLNAAARGARVSAVVSMRQGQVAREVIEMGSVDLRLLFRTPRGDTPVSCFLGMLEMQAGVGQVAPLRIRSGEGTVAGTASFDLNRGQLDLVVGSIRSTTGFFALDIPLRVHGSFADPEIWPAEWSADGRARLAAADEVAALPPRLRDFAQRNPCFQAAAIPVSPPTPAPPRTISRSRR